MTDWRSWVPDVAVGLLVLLIGMLEVLNIRTYLYRDDPRPALALVALGIALAVALSRRLPGAALVIVWVVCTMQVLTGTELLVIEVTIGVVAFGTARWGSTVTVLASALSIPAAAAIAVLTIEPGVFYSALDTAGFKSIVEQTSRLGDRWQLTAGLLGIAVLGVPWLAGLK